MLDVGKSWRMFAVSRETGDGEPGCSGTDRFRTSSVEGRSEEEISGGFVWLVDNKLYKTVNR